MRNSFTNNTFLFFFLLLFPIHCASLCLYFMKICLLKKKKKKERKSAFSCRGVGSWRQVAQGFLCLSHTDTVLFAFNPPAVGDITMKMRGNKGFSESEMKSLEVWNNERKEGKGEKWRRVLTRSGRWVWGLGPSFFLCRVY